jgi:uncharacterized membrane protein
MIRRTHLFSDSERVLISEIRESQDTMARYVDAYGEDQLSHDVAEIISDGMSALFVLQTVIRKWRMIADIENNDAAQIVSRLDQSA